MIECIATLPTQSKLILFSMLTLEKLGQNIFTSGEVSRIYQDIAPSVELDVLTHRRITDLINLVGDRYIRNGSGAAGAHSDIAHPELGQTFRYPGGPFFFTKTPWRIARHPPLLGEHNQEVYGGELGIDEATIEEMKRQGII